MAARIPLLLIVSLAVALSFTGSAQAVLSADTLDIQDTLTSCARALTLRDIAIKVSNRGAETDTYEFSIQAPAGWEATIQKDLTLASGESRFLDLFLVNMPLPWTVPPGTYELKITARSLRFSGESLTKTVRVTILGCYAVDVTATSPAPQTFCQESRQPAITTFLVKNSGRITQTFEVSATPSWATPSQTALTLGSGESATVTLTLLPTATGRHDVTFSVRSPVTGVADTERFAIQVNDCFATRVLLQPTQTTACLTKTASFTLSASNTGTVADTLTIVVPSWITASPATLTLAPGETKTATLTAAPGQEGNLPFNVSLISRADPQTIQTVAGLVQTQDCRSLQLIASTSSASVCEGTPASFDIQVKNTGAVPITAALTATTGTLSSSVVTVAPGDVQTVRLNASGTQNITVTATDGKASSTANLSLTTRNCYGVSVALSPDQTTACAGQSKQFLIFVKNRGELKDTYRVSFGQNTPEVTLGAGETKTFHYVHTADAAPNTTIPITVSVASSKASAQANATLTVLDKAACYTVSLQTPEPVSVSVYKAAAYPFKIRNAGANRDNYFLRVKGGPSWVFTSPKTIQLEGSQESVGYLYVQPEPDTERGVYSFDIEAASANSQINQRVIVTVTDGPTASTSRATPTPTASPTRSPVPLSALPTAPASVSPSPSSSPSPTPSETPSPALVISQSPGGQNVTIVVGEGGNVELNASTGVASPRPFAFNLPAGTSTKFWVLAGIVVIVIIILVARFALM